MFGDKRLCYALNDMVCKFLKATMKENYFHDFLFIFLPYLVSLFVVKTRNHIELVTMNIETLREQPHSLEKKFLSPPKMIP